MNSLNWQPYLNAIARHYAQWWTLYTLTDTLHRDREKQRPLASPFDFGLMVERREERKEKREEREVGEESGETEGRGEEEEKIERLPVQEGVRKYAAEHVLLRGRPGSGKSTALARLMLEGAEGKIPVLVELRFWQRSVGDRILASLHKHDPTLNLDEAILRTLLHQGCFLLLLDGVNELPSEAARRDLACFRQDFPQTPMIFTTRELSVGGDLGIEKKLEMQPLTEPQMKGFVKAYLPDQADQLLRQIKDRLREFGQTPLLLWMLCGLFQQTSTIPPNLGMVFQTFTQGYERNVKQDAPVSAESRRWWSPLLQRLSFVMMHEDAQLTSTVEFRVAIAHSEALTVFKQLLQQEGVNAPGSLAAECLDDLLEHHLIQLNGDQIEFRHQLLQEYYAAEYLLQLLPMLSDAKLKRDYLNYLKWTEAIAMMLALVDKEAQALKILKLALYNVDFRLGARLAGKVKPCIQEQAVELVKAVKFCDGKDIEEWLKVELLGITQSRFALQELQNLLESSNLDVAQKATFWIGYLGYKEAVPNLLQKLSELNIWIPLEEGSKEFSHDNFSLKIEIIEALENLSGKELIPNIREIYQDLKSVLFVDPKTYDLLVKLDPEFILDESLKVLDTSDNPNEINRAATFLSMLKNADAPLKLIERLRDEKGSKLCLFLIDALGLFDSDEATFALVNLVASSDVFIQERTKKILIKHGQVRAVDKLTVLLDNENWSIRWCAAYILANFQSSLAIPTLVEGSLHEHRNFREDAARLLGKIDHEAAINPLLRLLQDKDYSVRRNAAISLAHFKRQEAIPELIKAARGTGDDKVIKAWAIENLKDNSLAFREQAVEALGEIGTEETSSELLEILKEGFKPTAITLGKLGKLKVSSDLIELLENSKQLSSISKIIDALVLLIAQGNYSIIPELISRIKDVGSDNSAGFYFRNSVGIVLSRIEHPVMASYLPDLAKLLSTDSGQEVFWAIAAIQARCKFYNYEIFQSHVEEEKTEASPQTGTPTNIDSVGILITGDVTIHGNQIGTQHNSAAEPTE